MKAKDLRIILSGLYRDAYMNGVMDEHTSSEEIQTVGTHAKRLMSTVVKSAVREIMKLDKSEQEIKGGVPPIYFRE